jgi:hypothetical protein
VTGEGSKDRKYLKKEVILKVGNRFMNDYILISDFLLRIEIRYYGVY